MSNGYFDSVAAEVEELLQESGMISMVDLARRFKLGSELMQSVIQSHLGQDIKGQLDSGILTTDTYNERVKAQVVCISQFTTPCAWHHLLAGAHQFMQSTLKDK